MQIRHKILQNYVGLSYKTVTRYIQISFILMDL